MNQRNECIWLVSAFWCSPGLNPRVVLPPLGWVFLLQWAQAKWPLQVCQRPHSQGILNLVQLLITLSYHKSLLPAWQPSMTPLSHYPFSYKVLVISYSEKYVHPDLKSLNSLSELLCQRFRIDGNTRQRLRVSYVSGCWAIYVQIVVRLFLFPGFNDHGLFLEWNSRHSTIFPLCWIIVENTSDHLVALKK